MASVIVGDAMSQTSSSNLPTSTACRHCGRPVHTLPGRPTRFCPHCGARLSRQKWPGVVVAALAVLIAASAWHSIRAKPDPLDRAVLAARDGRAGQLARLTQQAIDVRAVRQSLADQIDSLTNLSTRLAAAARRADDEDRWPTTVAGHALQRADVDRVEARLADAIAAERPAVAADDAVLARLDAAAAAARADLSTLDGFRAELAGRPTVARWAEIKRQTAALAASPDAPAPTADPARPIDVDAFFH